MTGSPNSQLVELSFLLFPQLFGFVFFFVSILPILPFFFRKIFVTHTFPKRLVVCGILELLASGGGVDEGTDGEETKEVEEDLGRKPEEATGGEAEVASGGLKEGEANIVFEESGEMTKIARDEFVVDSLDVVDDLEG